MINFNEKLQKKYYNTVTSHKAKHVEAEKEIEALINIYQKKLNHYQQRD